MGIHVPDMESPISPALLARFDRSMSNVFCFGKVGIDARTVGTKNRVRDNPRV